MDHQDRQAIEDLFNKLADVERGNTERDGEAEAFIRQRLSQQPGAPYYMAQTIVMQDYALRTAQDELETLRRQLAERPAEGGGGFLSRLMGAGSQSSRSPSRVPNVARAGMGSGAGYSSGRGGVWGNASQASPIQGSPMHAAHAGHRGGGFLAGAAQTAMGVAGGVLLGSAIAGMFDDGTAEAGEALGGDEAATDMDAGAEDTAAVDDAGFDDMDI